MIDILYDSTQVFNSFASLIKDLNTFLLDSHFCCGTLSVNVLFFLSLSLDCCMQPGRKLPDVSDSDRVSPPVLRHRDPE